MEELLISWELEELIPTFKAHEISLKNIFELDDELLKEIIPIVGQRIKFLQHWREIKHLSSLPMVIDNDNIENNKNISEVGSDISTSSNNTVYTVAVDDNRTVSFCGIENLIAQETNMPDFELKTLLSLYPYGDLILNYYRKNEHLNEYMRNKLVDIIVKHIYPYIMKHRLSHVQYNILCSKIISCFPSECASIYYSSSRKVNNVVMHSKGKLVSKVRNLLYISPDKTYVRKKRISDDKESETKRQKIYGEDQNAAATWLKHNREPWTEVLNLWKVTHEMRRDNQSVTLTEFIESWPIIDDPRAYSLINADFELLFPGKQLLLLENWNLFFEELLQIKKSELQRKEKDPILFNFLALLEDKENISNDSQVAIQLSLLARIVPPKGRYRTGKNHWKFSTTESVESLIIHCPGPGDIERTIHLQKEKALRRKVNCHVQPYLIVVGESLSNISHTYLIIDSVNFKCETTLKGVDILFKTFFSLNVKYPCQSEHIWYLIQKCIFKIDTPSDNIYSYTEDLISRLRK